MSDSHHEHISLHACIWYWCLAVNDYDVYIQYHCKLPQRYNDTSESEFWMLCRGIAAQFFPRNLWRRQASLSLFWNNLSQSTSVRSACTKKSLTSPIHWPLRGLQSTFHSLPNHCRPFCFSTLFRRGACCAIASKQAEASRLLAYGTQPYSKKWNDPMCRVAGTE